MEKKRHRFTHKSLKLSVATYNIRRCKGLDGRHLPERVAKVLKELDADIIGLQEVDTHLRTGDGRNQLEYLAEATGFNAVAGPTILGDKGFYGNAILTKYPPASVRTVDLSQPGYEPRGMVDIDVHLDGLPVNIITAHLGLRRRERCSQIKRLIDHITDEENGGDRERMIIMGDFNEWLAGSLPVRLFEKYWGKAVRVRSFPTLWPVLGLDLIHAVPRDALISVQSHATSASRLASDHLPLKAVIEWLPDRNLK